jgi:hypothetical protein
MRACLIALLSIAAASTAFAADPLDWLSKDKKIAFSQLIGGYTEAAICKKQVDFAVAGKFFQEKLAADKLTAEQLAQLTHLAIGLNSVQMGEYFKKKPSEQATAAHCKKINDDIFGANGKVIPGLLK